MGPAVRRRPQVRKGVPARRSGPPAARAWPGGAEPGVRGSAGRAPSASAGPTTAPASTGSTAAATSRITSGFTNVAGSHARCAARRSAGSWSGSAARITARLVSRGGGAAPGPGPAPGPIIDSSLLFGLLLIAAGFGLGAAAVYFLYPRRPDETEEKAAAPVQAADSEAELPPAFAAEEPSAEGTPALPPPRASPP